MYLTLQYKAYKIKIIIIIIKKTTTTTTTLKSAEKSELRAVMVNVEVTQHSLILSTISNTEMMETWKLIHCNAKSETFILIFPNYKRPYCQSKLKLFQFALYIA